MITGLLNKAIGSLPPGDRQAHFVRNRVFGMGVHESTINLKGASIVNLVLNLLSAPIILNSFTIYVMKTTSLLPKPLKALMLSLAVRVWSCSWFNSSAIIYCIGDFRVLEPISTISIRQVIQGNFVCTF